MLPTWQQPGWLFYNMRREHKAFVGLIIKFQSSLPCIFYTFETTWGTADARGSTTSFKL